MDELDARLRAMAKGEDWTLPPAYETAMDSLEEQVRQGTLSRPGKRRLGKRVLILAAALAVLACGFAVGAAHLNWLSPVVDDGGNGDLMAANSVQVNQTVEGNHCDLTLENAITDGRVIYCLVTARYDETFPDIDEVMEDTLLMAGSWADVVSCWRVDQGEEPNTARFILATGQVSETAPEDREESYLGREVELRVQILDDGATGVMAPIEIYDFTVRMNDTIPSREAAWSDGTRAEVTPLRAEVTFTTEVDAWPSGRTGPHVPLRGRGDLRPGGCADGGDPAGDPRPETELYGPGGSHGSGQHPADPLQSVPAGSHPVGPGADHRPGAGWGMV